METITIKCYIIDEDDYHALIEFPNGKIKTGIFFKSTNAFMIKNIGTRFKVNGKYNYVNANGEWEEF